MAQMEVETRAFLMLVMETARLLGLEDAGMVSDVDKAMLRLMAPVAKLYTAKQVSFCNF